MDTPVSSTPTLPKRSRQQSLYDFSARLLALMEARGWQQSDLHRVTGIARDRISTYCRGLQLPTPPNIERIASALDVPPTDLIPDMYQNPVPDEETVYTPISVTALPSAPHKAHLKIDLVLPMQKALAAAMEMHKFLEAPSPVDQPLDEGD